MNRFVFIICIFCFWTPADAQNLIYNGSFEEYYSCPQGNDLNDGQLEKAKGWWKPTYGTSDYYNACNNGIVNVPNNFWGYQPAQDGQAYVGFGAIDFSNSGEIFGMEFVQTKLREQFKPCVEYNLTMYISLADKSTHGFGDIAIFYSSDSLSEFIDTGISLSPSVVNDSNPITDTIGWTEISLNYVANGTEKFVTIGYHGHNVTNDTIIVDTTDPFGGENVGYYYLDNVSIIELYSVPLEECNIGEISLPNVITPNNDGVNDVLDIQSYSHLKPIVKIVNRWGNTVALLDQNNLVWTGTNENEGVYFYLMEYTVGNNQYTQNGFIQLLR